MSRTKVVMEANFSDAVFHGFLKSEDQKIQKVFPLAKLEIIFLWTEIFLQ